MAMRTVGTSVATGRRRSSSSSTSSRSRAASRWGQRRSTANAKHAIGTATRPRPKIAPVASARPEPTGPARSDVSPRVHSTPEHDQRDRADVTPVAVELTTCGGAAARHHSRLLRDRSGARLRGRLALRRRLRLAGARGGTTPRAWSQASPHANTANTSHSSIRRPRQQSSGVMFGRGLRVEDEGEPRCSAIPTTSRSPSPTRRQRSCSSSCSGSASNTWR